MIRRILGVGIGAAVGAAVAAFWVFPLSPAACMWLGASVGALIMLLAVIQPGGER
jgi:ABC-type Fe3+-siderophore transport system permease subunit